MHPSKRSKEFELQNTSAYFRKRFKFYFEKMTAVLLLNFKNLLIVVQI